MFIKKSTLNRLLKEEREKGQRLFELGLQLGQGNKGFITGARWKEEIEAVLKTKGV